MNLLNRSAISLALCLFGAHAQAYPTVIPVNINSFITIDVASRWDTPTYSQTTQNGSTAGYYLYLSSPFSCNGNNRLFMPQQRNESKGSMAIFQALRASPPTQGNSINIGYELTTCVITYMGFTL